MPSYDHDSVHLNWNATDGDNWISIFDQGDPVGQIARLTYESQAEWQHWNTTTSEYEHFAFSGGGQAGGYWMNFGPGRTQSYTCKVNGTFYSSGSSRKFKEDIEPLTDSSRIYDLRPVSFNWKAEHRTKGFDKPSGKDIGLIAEEAVKVIPELGIFVEGRVRHVDYDKLSVLVLQEMKSVKKRIIKLEELDNGNSI